MRRRTALKAVPVAFLPGCIGPQNEATTPSSSSVGHTPVNRESENATATFQIAGERTGITGEGTASAHFEANRRVVITGTFPLYSCGDTTLESLSFDDAAGKLTLAVGVKSRYGPTATVECAGEEQDYRIEASVTGSQLDTVVVSHNHVEESNTAFTLRSADSG